jgi:hypothetical protein
MDVKSTEYFNNRYKRYSGKKLVAARLKHILKTIDALPNAWLPQFDHIKSSAIKQAFSDELTKGDRFILSHQPPLVLLDLGEHDPTYKRWSTGDTASSIQLKRSEAEAALPKLLEEILEAWRILGH